MVVRLRLARFGGRNLPFYRIYAADARSPRNGRHVEVLGYYNPLPGQDGLKRIGMKIDRIKYWISVGAQPTEIVQHLLWKVGIFPAPPRPQLMSKDEAAKVVAAMNEADKKKRQLLQEKRDARRERLAARLGDAYKKKERPSSSSPEEQSK
ncbi:30S ribosomal protein S16-2, chloroplastic/mitochondrial [Selaginella moellendorffii]|uniref:30S ribosomal protein S16-2, chloroplastic/mitochondrial n=1 Tax=Selaginella moellendorffii TaxID=88036 RepID=UPI000D1CFB69|nr:30S ribosomal protein S16-2, chloroplastic/mitochondrial [Selaginella moellendorffii]|eukprot:XP_002968516.2 30S ribosomal protein S16-2, chloroplastic/mitochondrial [Selaginella moellendorffii]